MVLKLQAGFTTLSVVRLELTLLYPVCVCCMCEAYNVLRWCLQSCHKNTTGECDVYKNTEMRPIVCCQHKKKIRAYEIFRLQ